MRRKVFTLFFLSGLLLTAFPWYWAFATFYLTADPVNTPVGTPKCLDLLHHFQEAKWQIGIGTTHGFYVYPPLLAKFFSPFAYAPYWAWHSGWTIFNLILWASIYLLWRKFFSSRFRFAEMLMVLLFPAAIDALRMGQNSFVSTLLLVLSGLALKSSRPFFAGFLIGSLFYKPQLVLPIAGVFLVLNCQRALLGCVAGGLTWILIGLLSCGWESYHQWILFVLSDPHATFNNFANSSIYGLFRDAIAKGWPKEIKILWLLILALLWGAAWFWTRRSFFFKNLALWEKFFFLIPLITVTPPYFGIYDFLLCLPAILLLTRYMFDPVQETLPKGVLVLLLFPNLIYALVFPVIEKKLPFFFVPVLIWFFLIVFWTWKYPGTGQSASSGRI